MTPQSWPADVDVLAVQRVALRADRTDVIAEVDPYPRQRAPARALRLLLFAVLAPLVVVGLPRGAGAQAEPPIPVCQGFVATIYVKDGRVVGGPDDGQPYRGVLRGTPGDDVIAGTAGPDLIKGHTGNDIICGGEGDDVIEAGDDDDRIDGGPGDDQLDGEGGANRVSGGTGINTCVNGTVGKGCLTSSASITVTNNLPQSTVARTAIPSRSSLPDSRSFNPAGTRSPSAGTSRAFLASASR